MRGSDKNAAIYYLAKFIASGEDPRFIARRLIVCAAEDVGNADPNALVVATAAAQAVERVGYPESQLILMQAALYIATAPKSNACTIALEKATEAVKEKGNLPIPTHLQDAHYKSAAKLGHGIGYKYSHNYKNHYVKQQYLPYELNDTEFYHPTDIGYEQKIIEHMKKIKEEAEE